MDPYFSQVHVQIAVYMRAHTSSAIIYASIGMRTSVTGIVMRASTVINTD